MLRLAPRAETSASARPSYIFQDREPPLRIHRTPPFNTEAHTPASSRKVNRPGDNRGREIGRRRFSASDPQRHPSATPRSRQTAHETGRFARRHGVLIQANSRGSLGTRDPCRHPRVRRSTGQSKAKRPRWRTPPITGLRDLQTQERRRALLQRTKTVAGPRHAIRQTRRCIPRSGSTSAGDRLATRLRDTA